ncbi:methylmalonic aciduria type A homolog, mitochondrial-like [Diadema antillarum]|uniref:methylmalonic aciduria type A homolog, mitochondrial-like n=1 Tax=Diadema antillarum TaxID=105358 RepID=UPI003A8603A7
MSAFLQNMRGARGLAVVCSHCHRKLKDGIASLSSLAANSGQRTIYPGHVSWVRTAEGPQVGRGRGKSTCQNWRTYLGAASLHGQSCTPSASPTRTFSLLSAPHYQPLPQGHLHSRSAQHQNYLRALQHVTQSNCNLLLHGRSILVSPVCQLSRTARWSADAAPKSDAEQVEDAYAKELSEALLAGERWALARAITVVESTNKKGKMQAQVLLRAVLEHLKQEQIRHRGIPPSFRIGLTGPPGAGKSTFIEAMGKKLTAQGHRVAVLAVDPSSSITGGSLLGDKTRMTELSRDPNAYIRASPSSGTLGGVTRNTNDAILLCEAAGYDVIIVETIGVGQSEYAVADMVDMLVLLIPPAGGDELQGLKKGIVERADFILINKADGELLIPARRIRSEYTSAVKLMYTRSPLWKPQVKQVSSKTGDGLDKAWQTMEEYRGIMSRAGELVRKRQVQRRVWMWQHIKDRMMEQFRESRELGGDIQRWEEEVMAGRCTSGMAADELLRKFSEISRKS